MEIYRWEIWLTTTTTTTTKTMSTSPSFSFFNIADILCLYKKMSSACRRETLLIVPILCLRSAQLRLHLDTSSAGDERISYTVSLFAQFVNIKRERQNACCSLLMLVCDSRTILGATRWSCLVKRKKKKKKGRESRVMARMLWKFKLPHSDVRSVPQIYMR